MKEDIVKLKDEIVERIAYLEKLNSYGLKSDIFEAQIIELRKFQLSLLDILLKNLHKPT
tara:strand:+ start:2959 stop:3135 length:177 start_codon:yes stop_codon:yes gene_type:complete